MIRAHSDQSHGLGSRASVARLDERGEADRISLSSLVDSRAARPRIESMSLIDVSSDHDDIWPSASARACARAGMMRRRDRRKRATGDTIGRVDALPARGTAGHSPDRLHAAVRGSTVDGGTAMRYLDIGLDTLTREKADPPQTGSCIATNSTTTARSTRCDGDGRLIPCANTGSSIALPSSLRHTASWRTSWISAARSMRMVHLRHLKRAS